MSRRKAKFTQSEVESAIRAAQAAELPISEIKVLPDGTIVIVSDPPAADCGWPDELLDERLGVVRYGQD